MEQRRKRDKKEGEAELVVDEGSSAQLSSPLLLRHQQPLKLRCMKPHHLTATNTKHFTGLCPLSNFVSEKVCIANQRAKI
jgi:hypothetical protein